MTLANYWKRSVCTQAAEHQELDLESSWQHALWPDTNAKLWMNKRVCETDAWDAPENAKKRAMIRSQCLGQNVTCLNCLRRLVGDAP